MHKEAVIKVPVLRIPFIAFPYCLLNNYETLPGAQSYD